MGRMKGSGAWRAGALGARKMYALAGGSSIEAPTHYSAHYTSITQVVWQVSYVLQTLHASASLVDG